MRVLLMDTSVVSAILGRDEGAIEQLRTEVAEGSRILLSRVVDFEVRRGFAYRPNEKKERFYVRLRSLLEWCEVEPGDWEWSIQSYASARKSGKSPGDADLLLAAQAARTRAVVVSRDKDFDHLDVPRVPWD